MKKVRIALATALLAGGLTIALAAEASAVIMFGAR